jgi:hypothetical protein
VREKKQKGDERWLPAVNVTLVSFSLFLSPFSSTPFLLLFFISLLFLFSNLFPSLPPVFPHFLPPSLSFSLPPFLQSFLSSFLPLRSDLHRESIVHNKKQLKAIKKLGDSSGGLKGAILAAEQSITLVDGFLAVGAAEEAYLQLVKFN